MVNGRPKLVIPFGLLGSDSSAYSYLHDWSLKQLTCHCGMLLCGRTSQIQLHHIREYQSSEHLFNCLLLLSEKQRRKSELGVFEVFIQSEARAGARGKSVRPRTSYRIRAHDHSDRWARGTYAAIRLYADVDSLYTSRFSICPSHRRQLKMAT
jgi:hypothetical protein